MPDTLQLSDEVVHFRDFRAGDEQQIVDVVRASFGGFYPSEKPVDECAYVSWFAEPHETHSGSIVVAEVDSRIISFTAQIHSEILVAGRPVPGTAGGIATGTHPDFEGRGIFRGLNLWRTSTLDQRLDAAVERSRMARRASRSPVAAPHRMDVCVRVLKPRLAASQSSSPRPLKALGFSALALWGRARAALPQRSGEFSISTLPAFDDRAARFVEQASASWDFIPVRPAEYLNWRYCDPRAGLFTVRSAEEDGVILGYAVSHRIGIRGHIVDMLALPGRLDVVRALIDDATALLGSAGAAVVECWMLRQHPYAGVLRQAGFVRLPRASGEANSEIGIYGRGWTPADRALISSPQARIHLVRTDFDGI